MKNAAEVMHSKDDTIVFAHESESGRYYRLGKKITVKYRGRGWWLCLTCSSQDRWQSPGHKGCAHIERVERWVSENEVPVAA